MFCIHADVTKEETLQAARIKHANGAAVVLDTDQDNLFVTMSIRTSNPDLFLLNRCSIEDNKGKRKSPFFISLGQRRYNKTKIVNDFDIIFLS